jgi:membrane protein required for colicin V production
MNWADYCIITVLVLSVLMGLWRGFIGEVLALACWVAAFWVAWLFGPRLAASFTAVDTPSVRLLLGYAICFIAVLIAGALISFLMRKLISGSGLSGSDRLLGMGFGLLRGLALVTLLVFILGFTPFPHDSWWQQSRLMPTFQDGARWLSAQLPPDVTKYLDLRAFLPQIPAAAAVTQPKAPPAPEKKPPH